MSENMQKRVGLINGFFHPVHYNPIGHRRGVIFETERSSMM